MVTITQSFCSYFEKLEALYRTAFGTAPTVAYTDALNKTLLISEPNEEGEVQWKPIKQGFEIDWNSIEAELGFKLCQELKEYYSTYYFLSLNGSFGNCDLYFYPIDGSKQISQIVMQNYKDAQYVFPDTQLFLIGNAVVDDNDNYFIYYDNSTGKLFCHESETGKQILLSYSIAKTISSMEVSL
ncbi:MAG: hypothetical protein GX860_10345 [Alcaligenaceae bacterium]|nr:hypothetical protein [Alcaligenaceae bacterium]